MILIKITIPEIGRRFLSRGVLFSTEFDELKKAEVIKKAPSIE